MSLLDILHDQKDDVAVGTVWRDLPKLQSGQYVSTAESPQTFKYDIVQERDSSFANILTAVEAKKTITTIKTQDKIQVDVGYYVVTQDNRLWIVEGCAVKAYDKAKETLRFMRKSVEETTFLRLVEVDNYLGV